MVGSRFSRRIHVGLPNLEGRTAILKVHLKELPLEAPVDDMAKEVAARAAGTSGAELANVVNEASLLAARNGRETIRLDDLLHGLHRTRFGISTNSNAAPPGPAFQLTEAVQRLLSFMQVAFAPRSRSSSPSVSSG